MKQTFAAGDFECYRKPIIISLQRRIRGGVRFMIFLLRYWGWELYIPRESVGLCLRALSVCNSSCVSWGNGTLKFGRSQSNSGGLHTIGRSFKPVFVNSQVRQRGVRAPNSVFPDCIQW